VRLILAALLALLGATPAAAQAPALSVEVRRAGDSWTAELALPRSARAWVFARSPLTERGSRPWRQPGWTVETAGVRIERRGFHDVLIGANGHPVPRRVRIRFVPTPERMAGDYDPSLVFSDGAVALYSRQFDAFPTDDLAAIPRFRPGGNLPWSTARVSYRDRAGPVLAGGARVAAATVVSEGEGGYILFGGSAPVVTPQLALVVDPALPAWLRSGIAEATPAMLARYTEALGPWPGGRPTIMVSWAGPTSGLSSMGGGSLRGLIVMRFEGEGVLVESAAARHSNLWFIAHEAAHFWLGQAVTYESARDGWITEGGAELLAFRAVAAADPGYDPLVPLQSAVDDCVRLSAGRSIAAANERGEHRAYYACGAVFALVAEASSGRPFTAFVRSLIDANRADGVVSRGEWLALLTEVSGEPTLARDIGRMIDRGAADPKAMLASLFTRAGVRFEAGADGVPRLR
jgi:Peptidase family M1 domain